MASRMESLYPVDIERRYASLDRIRDRTQFYEDGKSPVEFVRTGQAGLASAWSRTHCPAGCRVAGEATLERRACLVPTPGLSRAVRPTGTWR